MELNCVPISLCAGLVQKAKKAKDKLLKRDGDDRPDTGSYESFYYGGVDPYMWEPQELGETIILSCQGCNGTQKPRFGTYFGFEVMVQFVFGTIQSCTEMVQYEYVYRYTPMSCKLYGNKAPLFLYSWFPFS